MFENLRAIAVLSCLVCTILFLVGGLTDHWAEDNNGHWGLWEYCDNSVHNKTHNATAAGFSTTTTPSHKDDDDDADKKKDDDEEDNCSPFGLASIPAFFHIVRMIMVLCGIVLVWGILSGKNLQLKIVRESTFMRTHLTELAGIVACLFSYFGVILFAGNFKKVKDDVFKNSSLGWSYQLLHTSIVVSFPTFICMLAPSLHEKYSHLCNICSCGSGLCPISDLLDNICIRIGLKKEPHAGSSRRSAGFDSPRLSHANGGSERTGNGTRNLPDHDISLTQMSETDSDIFVVVVRNDENGDGMNVDSLTPPSRPQDGNDLPQYEDVASSSVAPPPSYDEVLAGNYLSFASSTSPSNPAGETSTYPSAPPSYEYNV